MFEGGLKGEVQNGERNFKELLVNWPVLDNKGIYIHLSDYLKNILFIIPTTWRTSVLESLVSKLEKSEKLSDISAASGN